MEIIKGLLDAVIANGPLGWVLAAIVFTVGLPAVTLTGNFVTTIISELFLYLDNKVVDRIPHPLKGWFQDQLNKNVADAIKRLQKVQAQIKD